MKRNHLSLPLRAVSATLAYIQFVTAIVPISILLASSTRVNAVTPADQAAETPQPREVTHRAAYEPPRTILPPFSAVPTDQEIFSVQIFPVPLVPVGVPMPGENRALADALQQYVQRSRMDDQTALLDFLKQNPKSTWKPALLVNLGIMWRQTGYFSLARDCWSQAWDLSKNSGDIRVKTLADRAVGELAQFYSWIGGYDQLQPLLQDIGDRKLTGGAAEMLASSRDGLWIMNNRPEGGFMCGPYALQQILAAAQPGTRSSVLTGAKSTRQGTSLDQLKDLADQAGMHMQMAKRSSNSELLINSVIHWKVNHYGALLKEDHGLYLIHDSTFSHIYGQDLWISKAALEEESDGYFLVPQGPLPTGWKTISPEEGKNVWGKGVTYGRDYDFFCLSCMLNNLFNFGMAGYSMTLLQAGLYMTDTPLRYTPPVGPALNLTVTYNQRDPYLQAFPNYSNLGAQWSYKWFTYISDNGSNGVRTTVTRYLNTIGQLSYGLTNATIGLYSSDRLGDSLQYNSTSDSYTITHADGSKDVFGYPSTIFPSAPRNMYLTASYDAAGNALTFFYDSYGRLSYINDAIGQSTSFFYGLSADMYKITSVVDPFGRIATFQYDQQYRLQKITDEIGITSAFTYDSGDFATELTTPYGVTSFSYGDGGTNGARWLYVTDPNGDHEYLYSPAPGDSNTNAQAASDTPTSPTVGSISFPNSNLAFRNTFYFTKTALSIGTTNDFTNAIVYHWLHDDDSGSALLESGIPESVRSPLEGRVYYWYPNEAGGEYSSGITLRQPSIVARLVENSTNGGPPLTQAYQYSYANNGQLTQYTDPEGRQTTYDYYTNGIDLRDVRQTTGSANDLLAQYGTYSDQHNPSCFTNAAQMSYSFAWNSYGQLTNVTNPKNEQTAFNRSVNGYLLSVVHSGAGLAATNAYGYDFYGRMAAVTNAAGYYLSYAYDNFDRPTNMIYPDGTMEKYVYSKLNLLAAYDRAGNRTTYTYDADGRPITMRDRLNRLTQYSWCGCGGLAGIIDPMGHSTAWSHDVEGRIVQKIYNDATTVNYNYLPLAGLLQYNTDAKGQSTYYTYNTDQTVSELDYSNAVLATPSVYMTYDTNYNRLVTMQDGTGTKTYQYAPVTGSVSLAAGRLASITNSFDGSLITYGYDQLGRITNRAINGVSETVALDALGRVTNDVSALGTFGMAYTNVYSLSSLAYPNSQVVNFSYLNNAGDQRLAQISNNMLTPSQFNYQYDELGNVKQMSEQYYPEYTYSYKYDYESQLVSASGTANFSVYQPFPTNRASAYSYDLDGNRLGEQTETAGHPTVASSSGYNGLNELTNRSGTGPLSVQFMGTVNEYANVTVSNQAAQVYPDVDSTNHLFITAVNLTTGTNIVPVVATDVNGNVATSNYTLNVAGYTGKQCEYDLNGNCTNVSTPGTNTTYEWDAQNRLAAIDAYATNTGTINRTEFMYDGFDRWCQIVQKANGVVTSTKRMVWDGSTLCQQRDVTNSVDFMFFVGGEQSRTASCYFLRDQLGSIREVTDTNRNVLVRYDYDSYGRMTVVPGIHTADADFQYAGYYYHAPSGLYLTKSRAYDADSGTWINRDPIGENGGVNLYDYVGNDPTKYFDPYGFDMWVGKGNTVLGLHQTFDVGNPNGSYNSYSFGMPCGAVGYAKSLIGLQSSEGEVTVEPQNTPPTVLTKYGYLHSTPDQDAYANSIMQQQLGPSSNYNLFTFTCHNYAQGMFKAFSESYPNEYDPPYQTPYDTPPSSEPADPSDHSPSYLYGL